jgi:hypothetical protein
MNAAVVRSFEEPPRYETFQTPEPSAEHEIAAELPELAAQISAGTIAVHPLPTRLSEVEQAWNTATAPGQRIVFTP